MRPEAIMKSIIPVVMAGILIGGRVYLITILILSLFDQVSSLSTEWLWQSSLLVSFPAQDTLYTSKCQQKYLQMTHHLCSGALFTWALASQSACQDSLLATLSGLWVTPECGARPSSPDSSWEWSWSWSSLKCWVCTVSLWLSISTPRNKELRMTKEKPQLLFPYFIIYDFIVIYWYVC